MALSEGLSAACLVVVCGAVSSLFSTIQPLPYMDEEFHVPQVQRFCAHNFTYWDPMITTPPGLYLSSLLWIRPVSWLMQVSPLSLCTTAGLRLQNAVFTVANFFILYWLVRRLHKATSSSLSLSAVNLSVFPVLFFFSFLYYTDVGTTLFTLAGYALSLSGSHLLAAMALLLAVCFRQTSIVWVVFVAGVAGLKVLEPGLTTGKEGSWRLYLSSLLRSLLPSLPSLFSVLWPYMVVVLLFLLFLAWNGSIVMGDKAHHTPCMHLPQLLYFSSFSALFAAGQLFLNPRVSVSFLRALRKPRCLGAFSVLLLGGLVAVHHFTYTHPYLLADNRHYPFYVWKNIFKRHELVKYLLVPVYSLAALLEMYALSVTQSGLWILLFSVCCVVSLVPQRLLEFRYFILPYLFLRLHLPQGTRVSLCIELLLYTVTNALTFVLFLYWPFHWPDSVQEQRFMW